ncbi:MAG: membrane protein [Pirellulaceae bacterium]|nr:MAG: membrane protein [Pirellulaceae bacterium]
MWQFGFPSLTWGFLLVVAPLLIHLIQLLRHRRIKWAAMDFLLESYRRRRTWVWLRQFLLLASRMAAMALLILLLAQWMPQSGLLGRWSGASSHHYILLDDSFSMTERGSGRPSAFELALSSIQQICQPSNNDASVRRVTLLRFSRAQQAAGRLPAAEQVQQIADLNGQRIDVQFEKVWEEVRRGLVPSQYASQPLAALELVRQLVADEPHTTNLVHVVSDFRRFPWENPADLRNALAQLQAAGAQIEFIHCARQALPNLAISYMAPEPGPRAAGVPLFVRIDVTNYSEQPARNVQLRVRSRFFDSSAPAAPGQSEGVVEDLPVELIDVIPPGQTASRRVQVHFPQTGMHAVEAFLPEDAVAADNRRWCVIEFLDGEPILVVDGDAQQRHAFYLEAIFQPGTLARTGVQPVTKPVEYLRDVPPEELARYASIYLLDVPRLDERSVAKLEQFVSDGGGLAVFVGPNVDPKFYTQRLYRDGDGLLPLALEQQELMPPEVEGEPDVNVDLVDHPIFKDLLAGRNPLIRLIRVERYFAPPAGWRPAEGSTVRLIAQLRSRHPFLVEKSFGSGRVVLCTSTYAPLWNDMVLGPNALLALQLQAYLAQGRRRQPEFRVGDELLVERPANDYLPQVQWVLPDSNGIPRRVVQAQWDAPSDAQGWARTALANGTGSGNTGNSGIYEVWLYRVDGALDVRRFAVNVDPRESDMTLVAMRPLLEGLAPARIEWRYADQAAWLAWNPTRLPPQTGLWVLLLVLLMAEQLLAYATSYHPPQGSRL